MNANRISLSVILTHNLPSFFFFVYYSADKCGNHQTVTHKVIIEHPPEALTLTTPLIDGTYSHSSGVTQSEDTCVPGKNASTGMKSFEADFNFTETSNVCGSQDWDENGCRLETSSGPVTEILSVKPEFTLFPDDVTVLTNQSISANSSGTGRPEGEAFCSTPLVIDHYDDAAILIDCGVWEIHRHWFIRPEYQECEKVTDPRLITERIQVITVLDVFPPDFTHVPNVSVNVPFLEDYGPGNNIVGYPEVEDQIYHQTLIDHANIHNTNGTFLFVSYPTTLWFVDAVTYPGTMEDMCKDGSLASVERTWTTMDRCGVSDSWIQTIHIIEPAEKLFGGASGYRVASPGGYVQLRQSNITLPVLSEGEKFGMWESVVYSSERIASQMNLVDSSAISVVLDSCPSVKMDPSYLPDGDIIYIEDSSTKGKGVKGV